MPRKGQHQSEEAKAKIRAAQQQYWNNPETRAIGLERLRQTHVGRKRSPETGARIKAALRGRTISDAHKAVLSERSTANWQDPIYRAKVTAQLNTPEVRAKLNTTEARAKQQVRRQSAWAARTPEERRAIALKSAAGRDQAATNARLRQRVISPEIRERMRQAQQRRWERPGEHERARAQAAKNVHLRHMPSPTSIERMVGTVLDALGIVYEREYQIGWYSVDYYIPAQRLVIECDGDYWHSKPDARVKDRQRDTYLRNRGYRVVRLTETRIRADAASAVVEALGA